MSEARHDLLPGPGAPRTLDERRPGLRAADDRAPVIRLVGDARFSKVAVFRGRHDPATAWQHHLPRQLVQPQ
jgi:hypothetical protein